MSDHIDYKALAVSMLGIEWRNGSSAVAQGVEALTYATLAVAEEQRTANLIAWVHSHKSQGYSVPTELRAEIEGRLS